MIIFARRNTPTCTRIASGSGLCNFVEFLVLFLDHGLDFLWHSAFQLLSDEQQQRTAVNTMVTPAMMRSCFSLCDDQRYTRCRTIILTVSYVHIIHKVPYIASCQVLLLALPGSIRYVPYHPCPPAFLPGLVLASCVMLCFSTLHATSGLAAPLQL